MIIHYSANTLVGELLLPSTYVDMCTPEDLAELAAASHWRDHPEETPMLVTVVHLQNVDGHDLGFYEVRSEQRQVFTARQLRQV
ncbi:hypothetical protein [Pseudomonas sp. MRSN 12121]|uniref:hypothetical protein n=1 Tax=Pseudomonas sp. MRSN 12121 TaxID=1611770 RepID=UPI0005BEAF44|nr:hypothetical protein [Pseudomonas sp. MRSN 12121]AJO81021.1 hypothetical protein TO66_28555 [Pseudomonas sp. MRSN 12121]